MTTTLDHLPIRVDFTCYRGDAWTRLFHPIAVNRLTGETAPVDMTGWTGRMQVRDDVDGPIRVTASSANGRITTGSQDNGQGTEWQMMVHLDAGDTGGLPPGFIGRYDIELTRPDGSVTTWYYGVFRVEGDITR